VDWNFSEDRAMRIIVTRSQHAKNCWLTWSEVTNSLPRPIVIGQHEEAPDDCYIVHCPSTVADVEAAIRDLEQCPDQVVMCAVGRIDEEITIPPDAQRAIDDLWSRFGSSGRLFGTIGDGAAWMNRQAADEPATT
jgi:hypothetical protein